MNYVQQLAGEIFAAVHGRPMPASEQPLYVIYAVLGLAVGASATPEHVHDAWSAWACTQDPGHPCLRPFEELTHTVRQQDEPFAAAIRAVMERRMRGA
jgi:hypothetical protein